MNKNDKILVTGASGMVGTNLVETLKNKGFSHVVGLKTVDCDLTDKIKVDQTFSEYKPDYVFHMAGRVRGIMGNMTQQGRACLDNILINTHVIEASRLVNVKKIVAMGTVAMYPDPLPGNPLKEEMLWFGSPHKSEYGYAQAKRAMLAQLISYQESYGLDFVVALSTNLYGPFDRFNTETGHVIPALIRKFCDAQETGEDVTVWGNGTARRDFLYVADAIDALILMMEKGHGVLNLASGCDYSISDVVKVLAKITGLEEKIVWDITKPSGQLLRAYDITTLKSLGFSCNFNLNLGLERSVSWFKSQRESIRE